MKEQSTADSKFNLKVSEADGNNEVQIKAVWLPMVIVNDIQVWRQASPGLTTMERFVIESFLLVENLNADDLQEIANIPAELTDWVFGSLEQKSLLVRGDDGSYLPNRVACEVALETNSVLVQRKETIDLIWFPETHEFLPVECAGSLVKSMRKLTGLKTFPCPDRLKGEAYIALLEEALAANRVIACDFSLDPGLDNDAKVGESGFPAYLLSGTLSPSSYDTWKVVIQAQKIPKHGNKTRTSPNDVELIEVSATLPAIPGLLETCNGLFRQSCSGITRVLTKEGYENVSTDDHVIHATIGVDKAKQLGKQSLLREDFSVAFSDTDEIAFSMPMKLVPKDKSTQTLFSQDSAIGDIYGADDPESKLAEIVLQYGFDRHVMIDRMWTLKFYKTVYDIRQKEDFACKK